MKGGFASKQGRGKASKKAIPSDFALIELKRGPINLLEIGIERCRTLDNQENREWSNQKHEWINKKEWNSGCDAGERN